MKLNPIMGILFATLTLTSCEDKKPTADINQIDEMTRMERELDSIIKVETDRHAKKVEREANSIIANAMANDQLSILVDALNAAEMTQTLKSKGQYTFFAPTNEAFAKLPEGKLDELMKPENKEKLRKLLQNHIVSGKLLPSVLLLKIKDANNKFETTTLDQQKLTLSENNGKVVVRVPKGNMAAITSDQIKASNGVFYSIDKVLVPETLK